MDFVSRMHVAASNVDSHRPTTETKGMSSLNSVFFFFSFFRWMKPYRTHHTHVPRTTCKLISLVPPNSRDADSGVHTSFHMNYNNNGRWSCPSFCTRHQATPHKYLARTKFPKQSENWNETVYVWKLKCPALDNIFRGEEILWRPRYGIVEAKDWKNCPNYGYRAQRMVCSFPLGHISSHVCPGGVGCEALLHTHWTSYFFDAMDNFIARPCPLLGSYSTRIHR